MAKKNNGEMTLVCRVETIGLREWLDHANRFKDYNYTHYWEYSRLAAARIGAASEHIAVYDDDSLLAVSDVRIKKLPVGLGGIAYISGGPMIDQGQADRDECLMRVLCALKQEYVDHRGLVLRTSQRHKPGLMVDAEASVYKMVGFMPVGQTNATILIDISPELDAIRRGFHSKWRNHLNKSERQAIHIVAGSEETLFDDFARLFEDLLARKAFNVNLDDRFFADVQKKSPDQEHFHMAIAYDDDGNPVGGHLSSLSGDTSVYLLGATNDAGRKLGAAYLLQWYVIEESKQRGCNWYDLGGIDQKKNPHVYEFKQRMGGEETETGTVFQTHSGIKGRLTLCLETVYRAAKRH